MAEAPLLLDARSIEIAILVDNQIDMLLGGV